jgi:prepilin-type N-terminal cleavage/methylation domain-containing protein
MKVLASFRPVSSRGFTLIEMIIVVFLLALAMIGILSVSTRVRINKSESDVADAGRRALRHLLDDQGHPDGRRWRALRDPGGSESS